VGYIDELSDIQTALPNLVSGYELLVTAKPPGQGALREAERLPGCNQFFDQGTVALILHTFG
jgi:hypothetical protein